MSSKYFSQLITSRTLVKLICYFIDDPRPTSYLQICRTIQEDRGAAWQQMQKLCRLGLVIKEMGTDVQHPTYRLNQDFILLNELRAIKKAG